MIPEKKSFIVIDPLIGLNSFRGSWRNIENIESMQKFQIGRTLFDQIEIQNSELKTF